MAQNLPICRSSSRPRSVRRKAEVFLASDDRTYITGTELFVDGRMAQV